MKEFWFQGWVQETQSKRFFDGGFVRFLMENSNTTRKHQEEDEEKNRKIHV